LTSLQTSRAETLGHIISVLSRKIILLLNLVLAGLLVSVATGADRRALKLHFDFEDLTLEIFVRLLKVVRRARVNSIRLHALRAAHWRGSLGTQLTRELTSLRLVRVVARRALVHLI